MTNSEKDMLIKLIENELVSHPCRDDGLFNCGLRQAIGIIEDIKMDRI